MGLYGGLVVNDPPSYPGAAYSAERLLVFSEIDAVQNAAADAAADASAYPSTIDYNPKYFLVNGVAFDATAPGAAPSRPGPTRHLPVRLANAGLRTHIAAIVGLDLDVRAEDGNLYPTPRRHSAVLLPAGKTHDALAAVVDDHTYAVYDRMLDLTNDDAPEGGMLATSASARLDPAGRTRRSDDETPPRGHAARRARAAFSATTRPAPWPTRWSSSRRAAPSPSTPTARSRTRRTRSSPARTRSSTWRAAAGPRARPRCD
jgi:hypothetical protein